MPDEDEEAVADLDTALERELEHERVRGSKAKQDKIEKITRDDHLD